jgi:hypothetical protein
MLIPQLQQQLLWRAFAMPLIKIRILNLLQNNQVQCKKYKIFGDTVKKIY